MNEQIVKDIIGALTPLAQKIGEGASALYTIYVRQQSIQGIVELIWAVLILVLCTVSVAVAPRLWKRGSDMKKADRWSDYDNCYIWAVVFFIAAFLGVLLMGYLTTDGLQHLLNPQYYALNDILCTVKSCNQNQ